MWFAVLKSELVLELELFYEESARGKNQISVVLIRAYMHINIEFILDVGLILIQDLVDVGLPMYRFYPVSIDMLRTTTSA